MVSIYYSIYLTLNATWHFFDFLFSMWANQTKPTRCLLQSQPESRLRNNQLSLAQDLLAGHSDQDLVSALLALPHILNLVPEAGGVLVDWDLHLLFLTRLQVHLFKSLQLLGWPERRGIGSGNVQLQDLRAGNPARIFYLDYRHAGVVRPERLGHRLDDGF